MIAKKKVIEKQEVDIQISMISVLSSREYRSMRKYTPKLELSWWLRDGVYADDTGYDYYTTYDFEKRLGIRPVLTIKNSKKCDLHLGDEFEFVDQTWTMISDDMAICNNAIGLCPYSKEDDTTYSDSILKKELKHWAMDHGLQMKDKTDKGFTEFIVCNGKSSLSISNRFMNEYKNKYHALTLIEMALMNVASSNVTSTDIDIVQIIKYLEKFQDKIHEDNADDIVWVTYDMEYTTPKENDNWEGFRVYVQELNNSYVTSMNYGEVSAFLDAFLLGVSVERERRKES